MKTITGKVIAPPERFCTDGVWDSHLTLVVEGRKRNVSVFVRKPTNQFAPPLRMCFVRVGATVTFRAERLEGSHIYGVFNDSDLLKWEHIVRGEYQSVPSDPAS